MSSLGVETDFRPLTEEEIARLRRECGPIGWRRSASNAAVGFVLCLLPLAFLFDHVESIKSLELPALVMAAGAWLAWSFRHARAMSNPTFHEQLRQELADGRMEVCTYHAKAAIKVEEFEDEGSNYFILLADYSVVYIAGQYLYDTEEDGLFPCTEFTVERTKVMRESRAFRPGGTPIPVSRTLPPYTKEQVTDARVPYDGALIPAAWDKLLSGNKYLTH